MNSRGAEFRDDETKLMFAYDYKNKFTLRVWGSTFKPALFKELLRLGVKVLDRTEATALLTTARNGKKHGAAPAPWTCAPASSTFSAPKRPFSP